MQDIQNGNSAATHYSLNRDSFWLMMSALALMVLSNQAKPTSTLVALLDGLSRGRAEAREIGDLVYVELDSKLLKIIKYWLN